MKLILLFCLMAMGCSSPGTRSSSGPNDNRKLYESREYAPLFPYEEFFKTSSLGKVVISNDGEIVYALKSDGKANQIFSYHVQDKKWEQLTQFSEPISDFYLAQNGQTIVFAKDTGGSEIYDLYLLKVSDKSFSQITNGNNIEASMVCGISADGNEVYYSQTKNKRQERDVRVYNQLKNSVRILLPSKGRHLFCDDFDEAQKKLSILDFVDNNEIHIGLVDLRSNSFQFLIREKGVSNISSAFVNNAMYFLSTKGSDVRQLWTYDFKTRKVTLNDKFSKIMVSDVKSYQNGKYLGVKYREGMFNRFSLYDSKLQVVANKHFKAEEVASTIFSQGGTTDAAVTLVESADRPTQFFYETPKANEAIYNSNQSRINEKFFSTSFSTMVTSYDGTQIPTHFFIPNGTSNKHKRPLILWVHGGPEEHVDAEYSPRIQFLTNNGFIVVAPNVRGSSGFGSNFQMMDNGDWGGGHIKDLLAVTNYAKTLNFVDENNLFIVGGSFGGFSVMSMITQHSTAYRAAIDIFGITEMAEFYRAWPMAQPFLLKELGTDPTKDEAFNKRISPLYHIDQIQIPLQIHQGANDMRVPRAQSDMLVEKMKERSIPVEYLIYPDEGHGFTKADNAKKCYEAMVDFLKRHTD